MKLFALLLMTLPLAAQTVLVVQEGLGQLTVFRPAQPNQPISIPLPEKPHEIELTPDGKTAFVSNFGLLEANLKVGTPGTTISVIDVPNRRERTRYHLPAASPAKAPHGLKLRPPKHNELFTNAEIGGDTMFVFEATTGKVLRQFPLPAGVHNFVFSPDGAALFAFTLKGEVHRIHPESGKVEITVPAPNTRGIAWTHNHAQLIVAGRGELTFLNPTTLAVERQWKNLPIGQIFYPQATPDGKYILAPAVLSGKLLVLDAQSGAVIKELPVMSPLLMAVTRDGKYAWISNVLVPKGFAGPETKGTTGSILRLNLSDWATTEYLQVPDANGIAVVGQ